MEVTAVMNNKADKFFRYRLKPEDSEKFRRSLAIRKAAMCVFLGIFIMLLFLMKSGVTWGLDEFFLEGAIKTENPVMAGIMKFITWLGSGPVIVGIIIGLLLHPKTRMNYGLPAMGTSLFFIIVYGILKPAVGRLRPDEALRIAEASGYSFPSGHSMNSMIFYGMVSFLIMRNCESGKVRGAARVVFPLLPLLIGISRIYLRVHYLTDVLAGWSMGVFALLAAGIFFDRINLSD